MPADTPLLEARPSWWNFTLHLLFFWLIAPLIIAIVRRNSLVLRVYEDRVSLEKGLMSKEVTDVFITDITGIEITQGVLQRMFGLGDVLVGTSAVSRWDDAARGLPNARGIRDLILAQRKKVGAGASPSK
jgi:uncharacterized membrane protein YdbT with pleckstrin-like domain